MRFRLRVFAIGEAASRSPYDKEYAERDVLERDGIGSLEDLEDALRAYLTDFSALVDYARLDY